FSIARSTTNYPQAKMRWNTSGLLGCLNAGHGEVDEPSRIGTQCVNAGSRIPGPELLRPGRTLLK
ncbi:MAG: hypothetical protein KDB27_19260, partial [Planctomycetales bacterium]|nr:hypothetical protein [Planctomycetales bacterium]